jgi:tetratricopeptide (TPR) repeat protein
MGPEHRETLESQANWACVLFKQGHVQEAEKLMRAALETQTRVLGSGNTDTFLSQSNLAEVLNREGRYAEAETMAREAFQGQIRRLGPRHPYALSALQQLGIAMANNHRYAEATRLFREVIEERGDSGKRGNPWSVWYAFACVARPPAIPMMHFCISAKLSTADIRMPMASRSTMI